MAQRMDLLNCKTIDLSTKFFLFRPIQGTPYSGDTLLISSGIERNHVNACIAMILSRIKAWGSVIGIRKVSSRSVQAPGKLI